MINKVFYNIADCIVEVQSAFKIREDKIYDTFRVKDYNRKSDIVIKFLGIEQFKEYPKQMPELVEGVNFSEAFYNNTYIRYFWNIEKKICYARLEQVSENEWECMYLDTFGDGLSFEIKLFNHLAIERLLVNQGNLFLHASLIRLSDGTGIAFSGYSCVGKSTQAELWGEYAYAEVLNGDRVILKKKGECWYGYGSMFAGSSFIYKNESAKLRAVVFLDRADNRCSHIELGIYDAFKCVMEQSTKNIWNKDFMEKMIDTIIKVVTENKIISFKALKSRESVEYLADYFNVKEELKNDR